MGMNKAIEEVLQWIDQGKFSSLKNNVKVIDESNISIFTETHEYRITARPKERGQRSYLGCIASCRKPRAGEDHRRGNDLADGEFSLITWYRILGDILSYEMVKVAKGEGAKERTIIAGKGKVIK